MAEVKPDRLMVRAILYGRVLDSVTGAPVQGARVALGLNLGAAGERILAEAVTDAEGLYHLKEYAGFLPQPHQVGVRVTGAGGRLSRWHDIRTVSFAGAMPELRHLTVAPVAHVGGWVLDGASQGVAGAVVQLVHAGPGPMTGTVLTEVESLGSHGIYGINDFSADVFGFGIFDPDTPPAVTLNLQAESGPVAAVVMEPGKRARVDLTV
ncbi:MAG TPA: hypothetical protein VD973_28980 [Symbiobacteriaceae bacterium]|nr:hypothetical protein [Symbiobacteriaceae bacterium]